MGYIEDLQNILRTVGSAKNIVDKSKHKSIAKGALDGTLQFPCLISDSIPIDMANTIARTLERVYASFAQTYLSTNNVIDISVDKSPNMFMKKFHKNIKVESADDLYQEYCTEDDPEYNKLMERIYNGTSKAFVNESSNQMIIFNFSDNFSPKMYEMHKELLESSLKDIDFKPFPNIGNSPFYEANSQHLRNLLNIANNDKIQMSKEIKRLQKVINNNERINKNDIKDIERFKSGLSYNNSRRIEEIRDNNNRKSQKSDQVFQLRRDEISRSHERDMTKIRHKNAKELEELKKNNAESLAAINNAHQDKRDADSRAHQNSRDALSRAHQDKRDELSRADQDRRDAESRAHDIHMADINNQYRRQSELRSMHRDIVNRVMSDNHDIDMMNKRNELELNRQRQSQSHDIYLQNKRHEQDMEKERFKASSSGISVPSILKDQDVKKSNDLQPYGMQVRLMAVNDKKEFVQFMDFIVGVKVVLHVVKSEEMIANIQNSLHNNRALFNFIRWTTGEKSLFKDIILNINDAKLDAANRSSGSSPWWSTLKRLKEKSRAQGAFFSKTKLVPQSTIVLSSYEVDIIRNKFGYDLRNPKFAIKLMSNLFLMNLLIVDEGTRTIDILYDGERAYQTYALETLEREVSLSSNKLGKELTRMISR